MPYKEQPRPDRTYGFWDKLYEGSGGYAFVGAEKLALMCLCAHRLTGSRQHLQYARDVCDRYLELERPREAPITPGKFGGLIALALDLYELTGEKKYLAFARQNADWAVDELYSHGRERFEEWEKTGSDRGYHYLGSAIWFNRIGKAMGETMIELIKN